MVRTGAGRQRQVSGVSQRNDRPANPKTPKVSPNDWVGMMRWWPYCFSQRGSDQAEIPGSDISEVRADNGAAEAEAHVLNNDEERWRLLVVPRRLRVLVQSCQV